ncbi:MAG: hypothetical protein V1908_03015 [Candidatus Peregrinibacteria bacterium]
MLFITVIYIFLFLVFVLFAAFIARLISRYGYLAPNFKYALAIFGIITIGLITFSLYLLIQLYHEQSATRSAPLNPSTSTRSINF